MFSCDKHQTASLRFTTVMTQPLILKVIICQDSRKHKHYFPDHQYKVSTCLPQSQARYQETKCKRLRRSHHKYPKHLTGLLQLDLHPPRNSRIRSNRQCLQIGREGCLLQYRTMSESTHPRHFRQVSHPSSLWEQSLVKR